MPTDVYDNLYKEFNPTQFDAREWIAIAQAAGMKYIVFTSRHHDGFSMFDTQVSDYKITSPLSPYRRDIVKQLADAAQSPASSSASTTRSPTGIIPTRSLEECLQTLVRCAGGDGNLLFNVGPMPDGRIEPRQVARLKEMGAWLKQNGESIYATRGGPWHPTQKFASTRRCNTVYLHVFKWDKDQIELPSLPRQVKSAALLGGGKITFERHDAKSHLRVAPGDQHAIDTIVKLELDDSAMDLPAISFTPNIKATASTVFHTNVNDFGPQQAFDGDPSTRWATDSQTTQAWIARDLEKPTKVSRVRIDEAVGQRVRKFELQYRDGDAWKTIFTGEKIGRKFERPSRPSPHGSFA